MVFEAPHGLTPVGLISALSLQWWVGVVVEEEGSIPGSELLQPSLPEGRGRVLEVNQKNNTAIFFQGKLLKY